jgi:hypothetical protein
MVDIQINSMGVEFIIDIVLDVDDFDTIEAQIISPSGALYILKAEKEQDQTVRVKLVDNIKELGIWGIQVIGEKSGFKSYSQVGYFRVDKNLQDLF